MDDEDTENLKQQLPHISIINEERYLYIAKPFKKCLTFESEDRFVNCDWIWEFRVKEQNLFAKVEDVIELNEKRIKKELQLLGYSLDDSDDSDDSNDE